MSVEGLANSFLELPVQPRIFGVISARIDAGHTAMEAIRLEPVIVARILRAANNPDTGLPKCVGSLSRAAAVLGEKKISRIVKSSQIRAPQISEFPIVYDHFWRHCVAVARGAEAIAKHLARRESVDPDELYCAGLLHDIGRLWLCVRRTEDVRDAVKESLGSGRSLDTCEEPHVSHTAAGQALASRWRLPPAICSALADHHNPAAAGHFAKIASIVHMADVMAHITGLENVSGETVPQLSNEAAELVGIPPETMRVIAYDVLAAQKELESKLGMKIVN